MTSEDKGHYDRKLPNDFKADHDIEEAIKQDIKEGNISCAAAFRIAKQFNIPRSEVGHTIDSLEISINKCQLGLFGYSEGKYVKLSETVSSELQKTIESSLINNKLTCKSVWNIAEKLGIGRMEVSAACEALGIKVISCQIGAF